MLYDPLVSVVPGGGPGDRSLAQRRLATGVTCRVDAAAGDDVHVRDDVARELLVRGVPGQRELAERLAVRREDRCLDGGPERAQLLAGEAVKPDGPLRFDDQHPVGSVPHGRRAAQVGEDRRADLLVRVEEKGSTLVLLHGAVGVEADRRAAVELRPAVTKTGGCSRIGSHPGRVMPPRPCDGKGWSPDARPRNPGVRCQARS